MIKRLTKGILTIVLMYGCIIPFIDATTFNQPYNFYAFILLCTVIGILIPYRWIKFAFQSVLIFVMTYMITSQTATSFGEWMLAKQQVLNKTLTLLTKGKLQVIEQDIGVVLILVLMTVMINLLLSKKSYWKLVVTTVLMFFFLLSAYNKTPIIIASVYVIGAGLTIGLVETYYDVIKAQWKSLILGSLSVIILCVSALNFRNIYGLPHKYLVKGTTEIRNELTRANFYKAFNIKRVNGMAGQSGIGGSDARLGGPVFLNNDPVFTVKQDRPTYWRTEAKYAYTGTGWDQNNTYYYTESPNPETIYDMDVEYQPTYSTHTITSASKNLRVVPMPVGKNIVYSNNTNFGYLFRFIENIGTAFIDGLILDDLTPDMSALRFENYPSVDDEALLREKNGKNEALDQFIFRETRSFPDRITDLALDVTRGESTVYGKAKRIEEYLKSDEFRYSLTDVPYVYDDHDYVSFFLFESKVGYCEHFSSAMVIMLRSLGIPARWAKGFSTGTLQTDGTYLITNADAHSWPEVYFEDYGWVPFEPTPSFAFERVAPTTQPVETIDDERDPVEKEPTTSTPQPTPNTNETKPVAKKPIITEGMLVTAALIIVALMVLFRKQIVKAWFIVRVKLFGQYTTFTKTTHRVIKRANKTYPRYNSETLREYINQYDTMKSEDWHTIVDTYEAIAFGKQPNRSLNEKDKALFISALKTLN